MRTLNLLPAIIWDLVRPASSSKKVLCDGIVPIDLVVNLWHIHDGMHIIVSLLDRCLLRCTTAVETEEASSPEILNSDVGAVGISQWRVDRIFSLGEVRGIVPNSVSERCLDEKSCCNCTKEVPGTMHAYGHSLGAKLGRAGYGKTVNWGGWRGEWRGA